MRSPVTPLFPFLCKSSGLWVWLGVIVMVSLACAFGQPALEPTSTPNQLPATLVPTEAGVPALDASGDCAQDSQPTDQDIQDALDFTGQAFSSATWTRSYTVSSDRVSVTWMNDAEGALGYLENLVYPCGYTQADVETFFSEESLKEVILQNYDRPELKSSCRINQQKLNLYEMTAWLHDQTYLVRVWVTQPSTTRLVYVFLTYPESGADAMQQLAQSLFPMLPACLR